MVSNKNRKTKYKNPSIREADWAELESLHDPEKETVSDTLRRVVKGYKSKCLD